MRVLQLHRLGMSMAHFNFNVRPQIRQLCAATCTNYCSTENDPIPNTSSSSSSSSSVSVAVAVAPPKKTNKALTPPTPKIRSSKDSDQLKLNWLSSLSLTNHPSNSNNNSCSSPSSQWVIGIDPDVSGALALFRPLHSPQVFDSPHLKLLVGKRTRRRLDPKAIIQLLQSFHAPIGTIAYLEQSLPYPRDGKQGWWSGGFNYGLWIGALVALGFSVVPVPSLLWKNQFRLAGNGSSKDDSREAARTLFPSISSQLTRKKDHGRAEALLIAAYGIGLRMSSCSPLVSEDTPLMPLNLD